MNPLPIDFDTRWKEIIEASFEDFVAFFLPTLYPDIDFGKKPEFLEQELHKLMAENSKKGKKINDKLVKVFTKKGKENAIFIHVEVEGSGKPVFSERMFKYFYRIFDKKKIPLTAIAIFIGTNHPKGQNAFAYDFHGTKVSYEYNTYRIREQKEEDLLASDNPFALVVLASLYVLQTKGKYKQRLSFKIELLEILKKRNYSRKKIVDLFIFMRVVLALPRDLEESFEEAILSRLNKPKNNMIAIRQEDKAFYGKLLDALYGAGSAEKMKQYKTAQRQLQAVMQEKEEIIQEKEEIIQEKEEVMKEKEEVVKEKEEVVKKNQRLEQSLINTIYRLYSQANHSPKEIASFLDVPEPYIMSCLKEKGLLD